MQNSSKPPVPTNLLTPLSSYIGREGDILGVKQQLLAHRLVTLTGPGGCGKTRLALRIAGELLPAYQDGVWLVEFAPLRDPSLVTQALATALEVRELPAAGLAETLIDFLALRRTLIVFDNCEHLVAEIARFADLLLRTCPQLTILATSRESLGLSGEAIWSVPPLSLPPLQPWTDPAGAQETLDSYARSEAVQLFLARVVAVSPGFALTVENGAWVAEICRRLDGMPLAIELAAARMRALSVKQIAERLDDRFNLLTAAGRTVQPRQQTLAAALDWSYALLTEAERRVLQRLSVFAGGATLPAAEAVCSCAGAPPADILDLLSRLIDKSLVVADQSSSDTRYGLQETIRQYAQQKLAEQGDERACRNDHMWYFVHWSEQAAQTLDGPDQFQVLQRYEVEHDNLRAALDWSAADEAWAKDGLRLAVTCGQFWSLHSHFSEGRRRFTAALAPRQVQDRSHLHARALMYAAGLAYLQADYPAGQPLIEQAVEIWRELGPAGRSGLARTLAYYGGFRMEVGDYANAVQLFQESLELYRQLHNLIGMSGLHKDLGWSAMRTGDYILAQTHLEQSLALSQEANDKKTLCTAYSGLGEVAVRLGQYSRAAHLLEQGLALSRAHGDKWLEASILGSLGWAALRRWQFDSVRIWLGLSLALRMEIGDQGGIAWCLEKLAEAAIQERQLAKAVQLFGAAAALRIPVHSVIDPVDLPEAERMLSGLRARLDPHDFSAHWQDGQAMRLKDVAALGLSAPPVPIEASALPERERYQGLSKRERETAAWIAQGKSNREIARAMTVGEKTVETYVTRILNKLGYDSRVQIAVWAVERGLVGERK